MRAQARLDIACSSDGDAEGLADVLRPDNVGTPKGDTFRAALKGSELRFEMSSEDLGSALSAAASLLDDAALFQEIWLLSRKMRAEPRRSRRR